MSIRFLAALSVLLLQAPAIQGQGIVETLQECPGTLTGSTVPQQVHLQATDDYSTMNVIWATEGSTNGEVQWNGQSSPSSDYCYNHDMAFHMATMSNLLPGAEVTYRVGSGNTWSDDYVFTPIGMGSSHFEWISIADHGDSNEALEVSDAIIQDSQAQIVTISGDISYADGEQDTWDLWFDIQEDSMARIPWLTAVGNHEDEPGYGFTPYEHRFDSDGEIESETFWYSRDFPGIHMVFMSTEHDYDQGSPQYSWLEQDLSSVNREVTPFVIVYGHKPMYSSNSYHGSEVELREALEELYVQHGVDLVIAGHDHFYERTWPVIGESVADTGDDGRFNRGSAPIHLVIGMAGRSAYEDLDPQPEWSAYRENSTYGWARLVYDGVEGELHFTHHRIDGTTGDEFTLIENKAYSDSGAGGGNLPGFSSSAVAISALSALILPRGTREDALGLSCRTHKTSGPIRTP